MGRHVHSVQVSVDDPILEKNLYGFHEIQHLLDISKARTVKVTALPDFPRPVETLECGRVWKPADVLDWAEDCGRIVIVS